ncbi:MAG: type I-E CRISPR-associated protein Cse2/CasB [Thermoanaerobaculia bacterium]
MTQPEPAAPESRAPAGSTGRTESRSERIRKAVRQIGWELDHSESWQIPPGDVAALRRSRPGDVGGPAFWKVAVRHLDPAGLLPSADHPERDDLERRWTTILGGMAEMEGHHTGGVSLGRALAGRSETDRPVSEARVLRLLDARGEALLRLVRPIAHLLASRGTRLDWTDFALLVLDDGSTWEHKIRRRIALDYYANLRR